jgi:hypothetical protein
VVEFLQFPAHGFTYGSEYTHHNGTVVAAFFIFDVGSIPATKTL